MKNFYVIGKNIQSSLSPFIHNYVFQSSNIDANYAIKEINDSNRVFDIIEQIKNGIIAGVNITNPYKKIFFSYLSSFDDPSKEIGAINCINYNSGKISGHNTDWYGFLKMLEGNNIKLKNKKIKIIGSGGGAKAVIYALNLKGSYQIEIYNRQNIHNIIRDFSNKEIVIINCTPYHFLNRDKTIFDYFISRKILWIDLLYTKLSTNIVEKMNQNHKELYINGIDMLIYQALASIDIWFSKNISKNVDLYGLKSALKKEINA